MFGRGRTGRVGRWWRGVGRAVAGCALVGVALPGALPTASAQDAAADPFAGVYLPPALGQTDYAVYVDATGHTVSGALLDYWRTTGASSGFGNPISEPYVAEGLYSQAFERGVFQFNADLVYTETPFVRLQGLGSLALADRLAAPRADNRRGGGGGDRRGEVWRPIDPYGQYAAEAIQAGAIYHEATAHTVGAPFVAWYEAHEGRFYLGAPLGEPTHERGALVQWFESGLLIERDGAVDLVPLPIQMRDRLGIPTGAVERGELPLFDEALFWTSDSPLRVGPPDAPGPKRIVVSLADQWLWAYQGETLILETPISSGIPPNRTESGNFRVRLKKPVEDMRGFTDTTGEVIWVAGDEETPPASGIPYGVPDVPNVMYINLEAEALHGAYWHNNFGVPMSHGCVNLPVDVAAFLFGWAPLGTPVDVVGLAPGDNGEPEPDGKSGV